LTAFQAGNGARISPIVFNRFASLSGDFVTPFNFFQPPARLSLLGLSLWATTAALAQTAPAAPTPQKKPPAAQTAPATFQSAMEGYKPYTDQKTGNWKEANELVARIGGWRAYAKEAAQTEPDPNAGQAGHDGHAGHAKPTPAIPTQAKP